MNHTATPTIRHPAANVAGALITTAHSLRIKSMMPAIQVGIYRAYAAADGCHKPAGEADGGHHQGTLFADLLGAVTDAGPEAPVALPVAEFFLRSETESARRHD